MDKQDEFDNHDQNEQQGEEPGQEIREDQVLIPLVQKPMMFVTTHVFLKRCEAASRTGEELS